MSIYECFKEIKKWKVKIIEIAKADISWTSLNIFAKKMFDSRLGNGIEKKLTGWDAKLDIRYPEIGITNIKT